MVVGRETNQCLARALAPSSINRLYCTIFTIKTDAVEICITYENILFT